MSTTEVNRFVSPYDDPTPDDAEGWEELYPYPRLRVDGDAGTVTVIDS